ncbi:hypothetical protein UFOVP609_25 [uncultured Caudovirales phage]|uniref:Uncharacterized protein n=1 Tax=uncultured Caudovirales phage TaxID=2100421 RepID=A0A6J5N3Z4_9CAUD|nr:hypothetical protein UFOVP609_25 [uncultured Caudovirales phage]
MSLTPVEQWVLELERERVSRWIKPKQPELQILKEICTRPHENKKHRAERDRVFYDAGRFAAGDRDQAAIKANDRLRRSRKKEERS